MQEQAQETRQEQEQKPAREQESEQEQEQDPSNVIVEKKRPNTNENTFQVNIWREEGRPPF